MKERPILFSAPMVKAILDGRKTQTRRTVSHPHIDEAAIWTKTPDEHGRFEFGVARGAPGSFGHGDYVCCPYGAIGDQLWVRETWSHDAPDLETCRAAHEDACGGADYGPYYRATEIAPDTLRWHPSIFMPRWASRITLEIDEVRVQRLQEISEDDARAEGAAHRIAPGGDLHGAFAHVPGPIGYVAHFRDLWDSINGKRAPWASDPWCWAISFRRST